MDCEDKHVLLTDISPRLWVVVLTGETAVPLCEQRVTPEGETLRSSSPTPLTHEPSCVPLAGCEIPDIFP